MLKYMIMKENIIKIHIIYNKIYPFGYPLCFYCFYKSILI